VIEVNRKILLTVLALAVVLLATPYIGMAHATKPIPVAFTFANTFGYIVDMRPAGKSDNLMINLVVYVISTGDMTGTGECLNHWKVHDERSVNDRIEATLSVDTILGGSVSGTLKILMVCVTDIATGPGPSEGTWLIISGTCDLANLHGQGTFTATLASVEFTGQVHFDP
jgi:hypothetical protein